MTYSLAEVEAMEADICASRKCQKGRLVLDPLTAKDLRKYIWYNRGGIRRDPHHWDSRLTASENSANYAWLDRADPHEGVLPDELAQEIGSTWPWFGIFDTEDLFAWLQANPG